MALAISYAPLFIENLEAILSFFDERNGSDKFSKKLMKMIHKQIKLAASMPEIGRLTDYPGIRILFVERFGIEYQIRDKVILIIDIYSCQTDPEGRWHYGNI
jgi:toxin YoeB